MNAHRFFRRIQKIGPIAYFAAVSIAPNAGDLSPVTDVGTAKAFAAVP